jgi:hypothetical protein
MKSNKKMTAVEWLYQEITKKSVNNQSHNVLGILKQAKEMEKKQIIDAYDDGNYAYGMGIKEPEQYYNEIYGGENNEQ